MKSRGRTAAVAVLGILCGILWIACFGLAMALRDERGGRLAPARADAAAYMDTAEAAFLERQALFEQMDAMLYGKSGVVVSYDGITQRFMQDKDHVNLYGEQVVFTDDEIALMEGFFAGETYSHSSDWYQLTGWEVSGGADQVRFTLYEQGRYEVALVRWPNPRYSPKSMFPVVQQRQLGGGWVLMLLDHDMTLDALRAMYERDGPVQADEPPPAGRTG